MKSSPYFERGIITNKAKRAPIKAPIIPVNVPSRTNSETIDLLEKPRARSIAFYFLLSITAISIVFEIPAAAMINKNRSIIKELPLSPFIIAIISSLTSS